MRTKPLALNFLRAVFAVAFVLWLTPAVVHAHVLPGQPHGFFHGLSHPIHGLDHVLAMIAVGLWAAQLGGRALWLVPLNFVGIMALGGILGASGVPVPFVETGIILSVVVLGLLIAGAVRLPLLAGAALVGLFALFHGHAHGAEMPATARGLLYGLGFVMVTALLHAVGIAGATMAQRLARVSVIRFAGALIVVGGVVVWLTAG